ncbi:MAG: hypothetical protein II220_07550 [Spirochaetales bacterium]|nr:hypothetical protein [Spirochaetales bacterium]
MKIKSLSFIIFLFFTVSFTLSAQPINQKAQTLSQNSIEVSGSLEHRIKVATLLDTRTANPQYLRSKSFLELSPYFQFRVGTSKWFEYQFRLGHRFNLLLNINHSDRNTFSTDFNHELYFENYFKFGLANTSKVNFSLLPQFGVYAGCEGDLRDCVAPGYFGISMGGIILFDATVSKEYPDNRFYWGLPLRFHYNIFDITELTIKDDEIQAPEIGLGTIRRSFPNGELGLSFGRQIQQGGFITRHEVFFLWGFCNFLQFQGTVGENIMSSIWEKVYSEHLITIGYNVSFGYESIY